MLFYQFFQRKSNYYGNVEGFPHEGSGAHSHYHTRAQKVRPCFFAETAHGRYTEDFRSRSSSSSCRHAKAMKKQCYPLHQNTRKAQVSEATLFLVGKEVLRHEREIKVITLRRSPNECPPPPLFVPHTQDPTNPRFAARCESNPALYTRCACLWFGQWRRSSLRLVPR